MMCRFRPALAATVAILALAACDQGGAMSDPHTGTNVFRGPSEVASFRGVNSLSASAAVGTRGGAPFHGIYTSYASSMMDFAKFSQAYSFGTELPYQVTGERSAGCLPTCSHVETGVITLTEAQFRHATQSGFEFRLIGTGATVTGKMTPASFQKALAGK